MAANLVTVEVRIVLSLPEDAEQAVKDMCIETGRDMVRRCMLVSEGMPAGTLTYYRKGLDPEYHHIDSPESLT